MRSPLRAAAAALLAGSLAGLLHGADAFAVAATLVVGATVVAAARAHSRAAWTAAAATAAGAFGLLRGDDAAHGPDPIERTELACVVGVVVRAADFLDAPSDAGERTDREAVFRIAVEPTLSLLEVRVQYRGGESVPQFLPGDRVRLVGSAAPPRRPTNPGETDRRDELRREGVCGEMHVPTAGAVTDLGPATSMSAATRIRRVGEIGRRALLARLRDACGGPGPTPSLLGCLLLGDRTGLDDATIDAFRDSGTAHLLCVSGLHVVLLAGAARAAARRLLPRGVRRRLGLPALIALLVVHCALCQFATPVARAAVLLASAETARAAGRRPSTLDALAFAAALVVAVEPAQILDPSFQLSFAAVAGLALFSRGFRAALFPSLALYRKFPGAISARRLRLYEWFATAMSASLAATTATAPIVAAVFGRLQPAGPLSNLVAVPIAAVLVPLAAALALVGGVASWLTAPVAAAAVAPLRFAVEQFAAIPFATIEIGRPPASLVVVATALLVGAAWCIERRRRVAVGLAAASWLVLAATPFIAPAPDVPEIVALDVGHGLCVLASSGSAGHVLFDVGGHVPGIGRRCIVPALRAMGVHRLAAVFISHQDADHCGALFDVLHAMPVGEVLVSPGFGADPLPRALVARCRALHVPVTVVVRGDAWARRGFELRVLSPCADARPRGDNEESIVEHATLGCGADVVTAVVPGDLEGAPLRALIDDRTAPPARVLLLPHHGRGDPALDVALARRLHAEVLVASTSAGAPMAVPGALVTGIDGAIRVRGNEAPAAFPWDSVRGGRNP